jgi:hypothetical protein
MENLKFDDKVKFKNRKGEIFDGVFIKSYFYKNKNKGIEKLYYQIEVNDKTISVDPKNIVNN